MGAMKGIYTELTEGIMSAGVGIEELGVCLEDTHDKLDRLTPLVGELATRYEGISRRLEALHEMVARMDTKLDNQVQKLLDRVIEMAMVNQGRPGDAATHQRKAQETTDFSSSDVWSVGDEPADAKWPPEGCDSMELKG